MIKLSKEQVLMIAKDRLSNDDRSFALRRNG